MEIVVYKLSADSEGIDQKEVDSICRWVLTCPILLNRLPLLHLPVRRKQLSVDDSGY